MAKILLVDDDPQSLASTKRILELAGMEVVTAVDGQFALECVRKSPDRSGPIFDLVITDVRMPRMGGLEFLRALSLCGENVPVILMTAFGRVEDAVWAMKLGAVDFLTKPFKRQTLLSAIEVALRRSRTHLNPSQETQFQIEGVGLQTLIGRSGIMQELREMIAKVAPTKASILLNGESGTGKELVARLIHELSPSRVQGKFIALNCAAVPENLIESELFGYERGAFTGAMGNKEGLFEAANRGTLLLDEIGDMPLSLQAKLLRVLQESEVRRLGATDSRKIDVRVISASHRKLKERVKEGLFREDLLYRLEVVEMRVPPLRERMEDLSDLSYFFLKIACLKHEKEVKIISDEVLQVFRAHSWPGNVRELSNVIERAVVFTQSEKISLAELPSHLLLISSSAGLQDLHAISGSTISVPLGTSLEDVEELLIRKTLEATSGDKNMTAKLLGINSRTIYRKLDKRNDSV
jgi:two-component system response regulator HydG